MNLETTLGLDHGDRLDPRSRGAALIRAGVLAYGVGSYLVGVTALVGLILVMLGRLAFTGGPVHIGNPWLAGAFNLSLLTAFGVQHTVMARPWFKERLVRIIHPSMERSTYVLATGLVLLPLMALWQPLPTVLWSVDGPVARHTLTAVAILGWAYLFMATFAINHFELFGLQQVWRCFRGEPAATMPFRERWMYRIDRHPIMTGLLVGIWVTPEMSLGHLLFAVFCSAYVAVGVHYEERALRRQWGDTYEAYRRRVQTIVPLLWSR